MDGSSEEPLRLFFKFKAVGSVRMLGSFRVFSAREGNFKAYSRLRSIGRAFGRVALYPEPVKPCVAITIRSTFSLVAAPTISYAASPRQALVHD